MKPNPQIVLAAACRPDDPSSSFDNQLFPHPSAQIAAGSEEQRSSAAQVNKAVQEIDKVVQQNAAAAEEMASSSEELASQAEQLQSTIEFFKVADGVSHRASRKSPAPAAHYDIATGQVDILP